ncbi:MAG TPA: HEPN domain-containing protein [Candidatus Phocaeicola gallistercoris]|nr:HEPN domain-containing protein [Candidatus Phocaeicola gallistercoris]
MKESLDQESRDLLIAYRIERAYGSLKEAKLMAQGGFYNASINRLYYACYYMAVALLLKNNISAQTHSGVKTMLGMHFTSKGKLSISASKIFTTLFEKRHSSDYDDFVYCDQEMFDELYPKAEAFIEEIKKLIKSSCNTTEKDI